MKKSLIKTLGAMLLGCAVASLASAVPINGVIEFTGGVVLADSGGTATSNLLQATQVKSWTAPKVLDDTGDFASIAVNTPVTFAAPWTFTSGASPFWSVGGFSFNLTSSAVAVQTSTFLSVTGSGLVQKAGFDDTYGVWNFSTQAPGTGSGKFSFSASAAVPDGGTTALLLGLGLLGLGAVAYRRNTLRA